MFTSSATPDLKYLVFSVVFKVYDSEHNDKVTFGDILEVLRDLTGPIMSDEQREVHWL